MTHVTLSDHELARLDRILAVTDLEKQRKLAYPMFVIAGLLAAAAFACLIMRREWYFGLLGFAFATLVIGAMRLGYYHLFRLLHCQSLVTTNPKKSPNSIRVQATPRVGLSLLDKYRLP